MSFVCPGEYGPVSHASAPSLASPARGSPPGAPRLPAYEGGMPLNVRQVVGPCHACAFFPSTAEEYKVLLPFAEDCAHSGERCVQYVDPERMQERLQRLARAGISVGAGPARGQVEVRTWDDAYIRDGRFAQDEMLALIEETMTIGRSFGRTHVWGNMGWSLKHLPGCDDLVEYESRLNPIIDKHHDVVICAYEHGKYSASLVMDILRTHPMLLVGDELKINPLYVPTERFLDDLRQRRAPRPGLRSAGGFPDPAA
jgi:hypothetical protein